MSNHSDSGAVGGRFSRLELSAFATFVLTDTRRSSTEDFIASRGWPGVDPEMVWQMPTVFIGCADQIREDLAARRERYGLSYLISSDNDVTTLTKIIAVLWPGDQRYPLTPTNSCAAAVSEDIQIVKAMATMSMACEAVARPD